MHRIDIFWNVFRNNQWTVKSCCRRETSGNYVNTRCRIPLSPVGACVEHRPIFAQPVGWLIVYFASKLERRHPSRHVQSDRYHPCRTNSSVLSCRLRKKHCRQQQYRWCLIDDRCVEVSLHHQSQNYLIDHRRFCLDRRLVPTYRVSVCAEDRRRSWRFDRLEERLRCVQAKRSPVSIDGPTVRNCSHHTHTDEASKSVHGQRTHDHRPTHRGHAVLWRRTLDSVAAMLK